MKRTIYSLVIALFLFIVNANAQTYLTGGIYSNDTLKKANSPYIISDTLTIFQGVSLTIEPGTVLKLAKNALIDVRGTLNAKGQRADSIFFTAYQSSAKGSWYGFIIRWYGQLNINYCRFECAEYLFEYDEASNHYLKNSHFYNNNYVFTNVYGSLHIDSCLFEYNNWATPGGDHYITRSIYRHNNHGILYGVLIDNNIFENNGVAIGEYYSHCARITNNIISNNRLGIYTEIVDTVGIITGNVITENDTGIYFDRTFFDSNHYIRNNKICGNTKNIILTTYLNVETQYNCWCSNDSAYIRSTIIDGYTHTSLGLVHFTPTDGCCPVKPVITGTASASTDQSCSYAIQNVQDSVTYTWTIDNSSYSIEGTQFNTSWLSSGRHTLVCRASKTDCSESDTLTVNVENVTGVSGITAGNTLNIYPNPNNGTFTIYNTSPASIKICDALGKVVESTAITQGSNTISLSGQQAGIYYVIINSNGETASQKLVIY